MTTKPWREVAQPHKDVLEGTFKQSEFAADISQVHGGTAPPEYQDAERFFSRTFITEGMKLLLQSVAERLTGRGGDPVIQLQTAFGGGKTHSLLAVYHLASRECPTAKLSGVPTLLDEIGVAELPNAKVAVIDGIKLSPSKPRSHGSVTVNTLWGELAWQLGGDAAYAHVAEADRDGTSPGKESLEQVLRETAPCVILVDELVAYIRQLEAGKSYAGGTFDSNLTFIQALTEAAKLVPNAILLASLPESEVEVGGPQGARALQALEKYFGRVESVWKPVATEEAFEIVRRRLFESVGDEKVVAETARAFADFYRSNADKFPTDAQEAKYEERIRQSYPIHPEVFDRLYEDWSTLDKFQRTRGVLQYMAIVIHKLWNSGNRDALIMPGSLPLDDAIVRNKSIHYLPNGWEPVIEKEIDGPRSEAASIDGLDTRFGSVEAARRVARTIFLGSAPGNANQAVRGIHVERVLLGSVQPAQTVGTFIDVIKRLRDRLHYLYGEQSSYWFDTHPNLRREMESRKAKLTDQDDVLPQIRNFITRLVGKGHSFAGVHVFTPSADIPDEWGLRLVVLPPTAIYKRQDATLATQVAQEIIEQRGDSPRHKRNRLVFLAPDADSVSRLKDQTRTLLAWESIVKDAESKSMNLDLYQLEQAKRSVSAAEDAAKQMVRETYKWLLCPFEERGRDGRPRINWEGVSISPAAQFLIPAIEAKLKEEEWVVYEWSPIHLKTMLDQWYLKGEAEHVSALKVWQDSCHYLYLPRLLNDAVLKSAIADGLATKDFFAYASGVDEGEYKGFAFGRTPVVMLDEHSVLISKEAAEAHQAKLDAEAAAAKENEADDLDGAGDGDGTSGDGPAIGPGDSTEGGGYVAPKQPRRFIGTVEVDAVTGAMDFSQVMGEVVQHFSSRTDTKVRIIVEVEAETSSGFDSGVQRTVKENCNVLKFKMADFE